MKNLLYLVFCLIILGACTTSYTSSDGALPILGEPELIDGEKVYHTIRDFTFMDQDSQLVNNTTFAGKAYVADFFFISCPTICPKMKKQMLRLYDKYEEEEGLVLLSHSIDTKFDTIPRLKKYATNLEVATDKWHFVTGEKDDIHGIAEDYFSIAFENSDVPGGYEHSGYFVLIDENRHVRAYCNGTDPASVDGFMKDIDRLLQEMEE